MDRADPHEPGADAGGVGRALDRADADADPTEAAPERRVKVWRVVVSLAVAGGLLIGVLPQFADLSEVWATLRGLSPGWTLALFALAAWNIATYQFVMMAALPGLSMGRAFVAGQLSTALANTLPAGAIVGIGVVYTVLRSFGHGTQAIAIAATVTGLWNTFVKLGLPVVALGLLALSGAANQALAITAGIGLAILVTTVALGGLSLSNEDFALRTGDLSARVVSRIRALVGRHAVSGWGEKLAGFQRRSIGLLRERWALITLVTVVSHLSLYLLLLASLRAVGVDADQVTAIEALSAFAFVRLVTALPITPGGLGVVELGMAGALTLAGGPDAQVVAGVLLFRGLSYALQVPLGALSWVVWRRYARSAVVAG
jgi:putative heme transporter